MYTKRIQEVRLSWGATALIAPFTAYGSVSFVGSVAGGVRAAGDTELARVHAAMLMEGTEKRSKKDIQLFLDSLGATLTFYATSDRLVFSGRVRSVHIDKLLGFVSEALTEPMFAQRELDILKKRDFASLSLSAQDTHLQAEVALARLLFAPGHPNHAQTIDQMRETLSRLTRGDLVAHHKRTVGCDAVILSIAGDIAKPTAVRLLNKHFKKLPQNDFSLPPFSPSAPKKAQRRSMRIEHKASIDLMAGLATGITSDHPDYAALMLGVQILGNPGFTGRLMSTVREVEGLTYAIYAYMSGFTSKTDGYISVWGTFAPSLFNKGRKAVLREIKKIVDTGVTSIEVQKNREMYEARSRTQLSNSGSLARAAHEVVAQGYAIKRLDEFPKKVLHVSTKQVNAALKKYLKPELLSESAAGPVGKK